MFYDRFIKLCEDSNIKPTPLLRKLGLSSSECLCERPSLEEYREAAESFCFHSWSEGSLSDRFITCLPLLVE